MTADLKFERYTAVQLAAYVLCVTVRKQCAQSPQRDIKQRTVPSLSALIMGAS